LEQQLFLFWQVILSDAVSGLGLNMQDELKKSSTTLKRVQFISVKLSKD